MGRARRAGLPWVQLAMGLAGNVLVFPLAVLAMGWADHGLVLPCSCVDMG
jgi:hypothetical protein